jgi:hypothetical protein
MGRSKGIHVCQQAFYLYTWEQRQLRLDISEIKFPILQLPSTNISNRIKYFRNCYWNPPYPTLEYKIHKYNIHRIWCNKLPKPLRYVYFPTVKVACWFIQIKGTIISFLFIHAENRYLFPYLINRYFVLSI